MKYKEYTAESLKIYENNIEKIQFLGTKSLLIPLIKKQSILTNSRKIYPICIESSDYYDNLSIVERRNEYKEIIDLLINHKLDIEFILRLDSEIFKYLPEYFINANYKKLEIEYLSAIPIIKLSEYSGYEDYLSKLERKRRDDFKRIINKIKRELGNYDFKIFKELEYFNQFVEMHKKEWSEKKDPSILHNQKYYQYYKEQFESENMMLTGIVIGEEVAAYHLGVELDDIFYYLIPAYDPKFKKYSVGIALLLEILKYNFTANNKILNLGAGQYQYKQWMANDYVPIVKIKIKKSIFSALINKHKNASKKYVKKILKKVTNR